MKTERRIGDRRTRAGVLCDGNSCGHGEQQNANQQRCIRGRSGHFFVHGCERFGRSISGAVQRPTIRLLDLVRSSPIPSIFRYLRRFPQTAQAAEKSASYHDLCLTFPHAGVALKHHLRSVSGSNGLGAKESSPLLGIGPILIARDLDQATGAVPHHRLLSEVPLDESEQFKTAFLLRDNFLPDALGLPSASSARRPALRINCHPSIPRAVAAGFQVAAAGGCGRPGVRYESAGSD